MTEAILTSTDELSQVKNFLITKIGTISESLPYSLEYSGNVSLSYSTTRIAAGGGSTDTPTLSYTITITDSGGNTETISDGILADSSGNTSDVSDAITVTYSISNTDGFSVDPSTGVVTASNRGTTTGSSRSTVVTVTVNYLGNTFTASETIKQSKNIIESCEAVSCTITLSFFESDATALTTSYRTGYMKITTYADGGKVEENSDTYTVPAAPNNTSDAYAGYVLRTAGSATYKNTYSSGSTSTSGASSTINSISTSTGFSYADNHTYEKNSTKYGSVVRVSENTSTSERSTVFTTAFTYNGVAQGASITITQSAAEE